MEETKDTQKTYEVEFTASQLTQRVDMAAELPLRYLSKEVRRSINGMTFADAAHTLAGAGIDGGLYEKRWYGGRNGKYVANTHAQRWFEAMTLLIEAHHNYQRWD